MIKARKSYGREKKLNAVKYYHKNGKNLQTLESSWGTWPTIVASFSTLTACLMTVAVFSLKSKLLSQYWSPNALVHMMSLNNTLHNTVFHGSQDASTIFNTTQ